MKRLKLIIIFFFIAIVIPLGYIVLKTYHGLRQEESAQFRYFAETLFDSMENEMAAIVRNEENRAVHEYNYDYRIGGTENALDERKRSPLSTEPVKEYILGYLQNNPDGSFQTPLVRAEQDLSTEESMVFNELKDINTVFNQRKFTISEVKPAPVPSAPPMASVPPKEAGKSSFAGKYLNVEKTPESRKYLGTKQKRIEQITKSQALSLTQTPQTLTAQKAARKSEAEGQKKAVSGAAAEMPSLAASGGLAFDASSNMDAIEMESAPWDDVQEETAPKPGAPVTTNFQVEVAPFQSVFISKEIIFIFRRIMIDQQIYRQGFALKVKPFFSYLAGAHFENQPMARFANLRFNIIDNGMENEIFRSGTPVNQDNHILVRSFPMPYNFITASLSCDSLPASTGRRPLNVILMVLMTVIFLGFIAIYQSARTIVDLSERRSKFVSSVTHELKTPLTNIRMYIEMLELGIAGNKDREQEYFEILGSESERLSRLITNVLELSKLEQKQRFFNYQTGNFKDVIREVETAMRPKLMADGFVFVAQHHIKSHFTYDREVMIQVLINLIENSIKFGKSGTSRELTLGVHQSEDRTLISLSDTGPGIPKSALKKVFNDFYRVDNTLTRTTGGTGIGLALVRKFVTAMGGAVSAANNGGPGCTITITLPREKS
ncbi:MAG: HAMP domain-containing histidine kinase [Desulfobacteraceae bacterium]|nr:HAMP domain-containing histidine kinase [Desulfobacteraceae bacterium]